MKAGTSLGAEVVKGDYLLPTSFPAWLRNDIHSRRAAILLYLSRLPFPIVVEVKITPTGLGVG